MDKAFKYIEENKGIDTEESYPYHAKVTKSPGFFFLRLAVVSTLHRVGGGGGLATSFVIFF